MGMNFTTNPGFESRLSAWASHVKKTKVERPIVTISREFGCEAYPVAKLLSERFNKVGEEEWIIVDRKLLDTIAERSGYRTEEVKHVGDVNGIFQNMLQMFFGKEGPEQYEVFKYLHKAILETAKGGNCILVGQGSVVLTKDFPRACHIRLVAPMGFRVKNTMKNFDMSEEEATKYVENNSYERDDYIRKFAGASVSDPTLYHLVINNEKNTPEQIADMIGHFMDTRIWPE